MFLTLVGKKKVQLSESVLVGASSHASFATVILEKIEHIWIFLTTSIDVCSRVGKFSWWNDIRGCRETLTGQTTVLCQSGLISAWNQTRSNMLCCLFSFQKKFKMPQIQASVPPSLVRLFQSLVLEPQILLCSSKIQKSWCMRSSSAV